MKRCAGRMAYCRVRRGGSGHALARQVHGAGALHLQVLRTKFSVTMGTVFERSHIPLKQVDAGLTAHGCVARRENQRAAAAAHARRDLQNGVVHGAPHARSDGAARAPAPLGGEGKVVEADETYVGGKEKNKHATSATREEHRRRASEDRLHAGRARRARPLVPRGQRERRRRCARSSSSTQAASRTLMTDDARPISAVGERVRRATRRVEPRQATNTCAAMPHSKHGRRLFRDPEARRASGPSTSVSEAHLHRYLAEFDFRYSNRAALGVDDDAARGRSRERIERQAPHLSADWSKPRTLKQKARRIQVMRRKATIAPSR